MRINANQKSLMKCVQIAGSVAVHNFVVHPAVSCIRLVAEESSFHLEATDLETGLRLLVPDVEIEEEGVALVSWKKFNDILRSFSRAGQESIEIRTNKREVVIEGEGSKFRLRREDSEEFPVLENKVGDNEYLQLEAEWLKDAIAKTVIAAAIERGTYTLNGVKIELKDRQLRFVATDRRRLAVVEREVDNEKGLSWDAIVPNEGLKAIDKFIDRGKDEFLDVAISDNRVFIRKKKEGYIFSQLLSGIFPIYKPLIPTDMPIEVEIDVDLFLRGVLQARVLTSDESKAVSFSFQEGEVVLRSSDPELGESEIRLELPYDNEPLEIAFNPDYLISALKVIDTETAILHLKAPDAPCVLLDKQGFTYVLMPIWFGTD